MSKLFFGVFTLNQNNTQTKSPIWLALYVAALGSTTLMGYEIIRSTANTLVKSEYGTENFPLMMALSPLCVLFFIYLYNISLSRFGSKWTLFISSILFGIAFIVSSYSLQKNWKSTPAILFMLKDAYIVLLIEQYWSFLNSKLSKQEAKKWTGMICGVGSIGSLAGAALLSSIVTKFGNQWMPSLTGVLCVFSGVVSYRMMQHFGEPRKEATSTNQSTGWKDGFSMFKKFRLLRNILLIVLTTQVVSALVSYLFQLELSQHFSDPNQETAWSGKFYAWLSVAACFCQFIVTPILLAKISARTIQVLIPCTLLIISIFVAFQPSLFSIGLLFLCFKAFDYSLFRSSKEILYMDLPYDAKYRSKQLIDSLGYRFSKGAMGATIRGAELSIKSLGVTTWLVSTPIIIGFWLFLSWKNLKSNK